MTSPLSSLAKRKQEIADKLYKDLPVPRWSEPQIVVRYRPFTQAEVSAAGDAVVNAKGRKSKSEVGFRENIKGLVKTCTGIYGVFDGENYTLDTDDPEHWLPFDVDSPDAEWVRFDETLGAALGVEDNSAAAVCQGLFHTEGDLLSHARQLADWSGFAADLVDEEFVGE